MKTLFFARLFYEALKANKLSNYKKLVKHFETLKFKSNKLLLFRGKGLPIGKDPFKDNIGICWSFDAEKAYPYNGKGEPHKLFYRYHALIPFNSINWKRTLELSLGEFTREREVRLYYQKPVYVYQCDKIVILPPYREEKWNFPKQIQTVKYNNTKYFT